MKDLYKDFEKLTPSQAITQGYTKCVAEGGDVAYAIMDCVEDGLLDDKYIVCDKEPRSAYQFSVRDFKAMLESHLENQEEDTFACMEQFEDLIKKESFTDIVRLLNEKLASVKFWPCVSILLINEKEEK